MPLGDHRHLLAPWHELRAFHAAEGSAVAHEARPIAQRREDPSGVDSGVAEEGHGEVKAEIRGREVYRKGAEARRGEEGGKKKGGRVARAEAQRRGEIE